MTEHNSLFQEVGMFAKLRRRMEFSLVVITVCMIFIAVAYVFYGDVAILDTLIAMILLCMGILLTIITTFCKRIMLAKLVYENRMMHIRQAKIVTVHAVSQSKKELRSNPDVFVSCFGVLIDTKVIKFNIDGVHLKTVELGGNYIKMTYGKGQKNETMHILHETTSVQEMICIAETFRYETGVIPVLVDDK